MRGGAEQIAKTSQRKRANGVAIVTCQEVTIIVFVREDAEMVFPKIDHYLVQLTFTVNRAQQLGALQFSHDHLWIFGWRRRLWRRERRAGGARHPVCFFFLNFRRLGICHLAAFRRPLHHFRSFHVFTCHRRPARRIFFRRHFLDCNL